MVEIFLSLLGEDKGDLLKIVPEIADL